MYRLKTTSKYRKDLKRILRQGKNITLLNDVINTLLEGKILEKKYRDHALTGDMSGFRECHIQPDWLLIYIKDEETLILTASRTGPHSEIL